MLGIKILGTGRYVPKFGVNNDDFKAIVDTTDEWIRTRTGMQVRHFADKDEPVWYMGSMAAKEALKEASLDAADIDMIVLTTVSPDYKTPSTACLIQRELGAVNAFAFDINVACAGLSYAFDLARRYLLDGDIKNILVVNAECLTGMTDFEDRATCVLFGDGAGASVLTASDSRFASYIKSDATGAHLIYAKSEELVAPFLEKDTEKRVPFPTEENGCIHMNGKEVYKFATKVMPAAIEKSCKKLNISPSDLDLIIPHQANYRIIETAIKNLKLPEEKFYVNVQDFGNTSSASIAIGLDQCIKEGKIKRGDLVCLVGFGAGLTYGACIFEY